jgi:hypothetical protein
MRPLVVLGHGLLATVIAMLLIGLHRAFVANINWDEFYFLSLLHLYQNGELSNALQTLHVHLFGWLPLISDNEIHQILAARVAIWALTLGTCWLTFLIARKFCTREAALLSILFFLGFSYVMDHGLSFRSDPLCAFLFMASLYLLLDSGRKPFHISASACLMAAATMISIKSAFYFSTIGAVFLVIFLTAGARRAAVKDFGIFAVVFASTLLILYQIHGQILAGATITESSGYIKESASKTLLSGPLLPRMHYIVRAITENYLIWMFVLFGLLRAIYGAVRGIDRKEALLVVSFALPLLSLLIYRNAFPYFFVFLMPSVVVLGAYFADLIIVHYNKSRAGILIWMLVATSLLISTSFVMDYLRKLPDQQIAQSQVVVTIHKMYAEPVPYIDRNSMISSFPKVGFFMTGWGMERYRARKNPVMHDLLRQYHPKFLIANSCSLEVFQPAKGPGPVCRHELFEADRNTLSAHFVHHWGAIYVAGKKVELQQAGRRQTFEILIPGIYTVEAGTSITIDGVSHQPGSQVMLTQGVHVMLSTVPNMLVTLRHGSNLYKPEHGPADQPLFFKF